MFRDDEGVFQENQGRQIKAGRESYAEDRDHGSW